MARVLNGSQFYLHTPRLSANGMNHTCLLPSQPKLVLIYRPQRDGRLSWPWVAGWLHTKINVRHRELNPDMVDHLSTNRARRWLTSLIKANALTTTPDHQPTSYVCHTCVCVCEVFLQSCVVACYSVNCGLCGVCLSLGLKVPAIVDEVKSSLAAGLCVVIGLQTTGEVVYSVLCCIWVLLLLLILLFLPTGTSLLVLYNYQGW